MEKEENIFPPVLRRALKSLANPVRQKIITYLIYNVEAPPTVIEQELGLPKDSIYYHLDILIKGNIISKKIRNGRPVYTMTRFGLELVDTLMSLVSPKTRGEDTRG